MKSTVFLLIFSTSLGWIYGQEEKDSTKFEFNNMTITFKNKEDKEDSKGSDIHLWRGLEFGVNGYFMDNSLGINNDPENPHMELNYGRSFVLNWNIMEYNTGLGTEKVRFTTGLGFRFGRYAFKNTNKTLRFNDTEVFNVTDSLKSFDKNFFNTTYLNAPLMVSIVPGDDFNKSFHLSLGGIINYRLGSRIKQVYETSGQKRKDINRGHYHLSPFLFDATARIGVGRFIVFSTYSLNGLFEKNKGPEYHPFSVGLSMNF